LSDARIDEEILCIKHEGVDYAPYVLEAEQWKLVIRLDENLPYVWLHLGKVGQQIKHDMAPLFIVQSLVHRITCTSKLPSENAEARFIIASIVMRGWIMHARKLLTIVFSCEV